jgi:hypothetical protein
MRRPTIHKPPLGTELRPGRFWSKPSEVDRGVVSDIGPRPSARGRVAGFIEGLQRSHQAFIAGTFEGFGNHIAEFKKFLADRHFPPAYRFIEIIGYLWFFDSDHID